jgi:gamma-glutamyltranspeptidase/glutathione hydrolase
MSPTIVFDKGGNFVLGIGSPGGPSIISYVAQSLVAVLDGGLSPQEAISLPRHLNPNTGTTLERSPWADQVAAGLTAMGHSVRTAGGEGSGLHAIRKVPGGYLGGADPRRDGVVVGE